MKIIGTQPPMLLRAKLRLFASDVRKHCPKSGEGVYERPPHERVNRAFTVGDHEVSRMLTADFPDTQFVTIGDGKSRVTVDVVNGGFVVGAVNPPLFKIKNFWAGMSAVVDEFVPTRPSQALG